MSHISLRKIAALLVICSGAGQSAYACQITVSAASSLTNAFQQVARQFTQQQRCKVLLNFAASGALLQQLHHGAPADVLATADQATMDLAEQKQLLEPFSRRNFIRNNLVLIAPLNSQNPPENPATSHAALARLTTSEVKYIAIGNPTVVPAGRYAHTALKRAGLLQEVSHKVIPALNVRQVLDYVSRAEVGAGFVYASDITSQQVKLLAEVDSGGPILYPAAVIKSSSNPQIALEFVAFLLSAPAQKILLQHGFLPVPTQWTQP